MGLSFAVRLQALGILLTTASLCGAQQARISGIVRQNNMQEIQGSVSPRALGSVDKGPVAPETPLLNLSLRFSRTPAQEQALTRLLADQQSPVSPNFHHWLTPDEFHRQFGLADADVIKLTQWLTEEGFAVTEVARSGTFLRFSGSAATVRQAFGVALHRVTLGGVTQMANLTPAKLPAEVAAVTQGITGLTDSSFKPHFISGKAVSVALQGGGALRPQYTSSTGAHFLAPDDFHTIYDETPLLLTGTDGSGVSIAIVGQTDVNLSDIAAFRSAAGLPPNAPTVSLFGSDPGSGSNADVLESEIGLEWAGAAAPGANLIYVNSINVVDGSLTEAIDKNLAPIIAISYGDCEASLGANSLAYYSQLLEQASAEGITVIAPSGDAGATDCDGNVASATHGLAVDFPASSPQVTGVGGTRFNEGSAIYFTAINGAHGGSALSYIPETAWNDGAMGGISASGGGRSAYFAKPVWQSGAGVPNDFSRDIPDVSLNASPNHDPYLICTGGHCANGFLDGTGAVEYVGGTSVGSPAFAGLLALVMQKTGRLGNANPVVYALANSSYGSAVFHDVTSGSNASSCTPGATDCPAGGSIGFAAGPGFDMATGLGSVDAFNLVKDWLLVTPTLSATGPVPTLTDIAGSANAVAAGTPVSFTASVKSASAGATNVPTGSMQFTLDAAPIGSPVTLSSMGTSNFTFSFAGIAAGKHTVQATYSGDATYAGSKGAFVVTISPANQPDFSLTPASTAVSVASGTVGQGVVFTVTSLNGFAGQVQFAISAPATLDAEYSFSTNPVDLIASGSGTTTLVLFAYKGAPQGRATKAAFSDGSVLQAGRGYRCAAATVFSVSFLFILIRRRRAPFLLSLLISISTACLSGCGSPSGSPATSNVATKPGTYPVLITATATANGATLVHSSTITFTVN